MGIDKRFALLRDGVSWYAASVGGTYRLSRRGESRDAFGQALQTTDLAAVARAVVKDGMRMRCSPENGSGAPSSLDLDSRGVCGYRLDAELAAAIGVPAEG